MMKMPMINACSITECAYNMEKRCHALAVTIGDNFPRCDTFMKRDSKGGDMDAIGGVGACKVEKCKYNMNLECSAESINVSMHSGQAECATFAPMP
jgi:hypothetical protein